MVELPSEAERAVVRHALARGHLSREQLREALLLREQLRRAGEPTGLLSLLKTRYLERASFKELGEVYLQAVTLSRGRNRRVDTPASIDDLPTVKHLPKELLERSTRLARRPESEDSDEIRDFLSSTAETEMDVRLPPARDVGPAETRPESASGSEGAKPVVPGLRFERLAVIERAGPVTVYRVRDPKVGREAVLRIVDDERAEDTSTLRLFDREVRMTARLTHPAIPPIHEIGTIGGRPWVLMGWFEGRTLEQLAVELDGARRGGREETARLRELLEVLLRAAEAIAYAHSRGVVHRDLCPEKIRAGRFGAVAVGGWGFAKDLSAAETDGELLRESAPRQLDPDETKAAGLTKGGAVVGTPGYMPPEQVEDIDVDERADVFALGAILARLLTGRPPFDGETDVERLGAAVRGRVVFPRDRRPDVSARLDAIASSALTPDRDDRKSSAGAFVRDLRAYLGGESAGASNVEEGPGVLDRLARWIGRPPARPTG